MWYLEALNLGNLDKNRWQAPAVNHRKGRWAVMPSLSQSKLDMEKEGSPCNGVPSLGLHSGLDWLQSWRGGNLVESIECGVHDTDKWTCQTWANGVGISQTHYKYQAGLYFQGENLISTVVAKLEDFVSLGFPLNLSLADYKVRFFSI